MESLRTKGILAVKKAGQEIPGKEYNLHEDNGDWREEDRSPTIVGEEAVKRSLAISHHEGFVTRKKGEPRWKKDMIRFSFYKGLS